MAQKIDGGSIVARLVLDSKKFSAGLKKMTALAGQFAKRTRSMVKGMGERMDFWGGRMVESAERFTFLAGAIMAPIILSMKKFGDENAIARGKIKELSEQLRNVPPFDFANQARIGKQLLEMQKVEQETRKAAFTGRQLSKTYKDLNYQIGKLLWEALGPIVPQIIKGVKGWILWIKANKELAMRIAKVAASFGGLMLVMAPLFAIGGKIIRVFGAWVRLFSLLFSPIGLIVLAFGALYLGIKKQLDPVLKTLWENTKKIFDSWMSGDITTKDAIGKILTALKDGWNTLSVELGGWPNIILETVTQTAADIIMVIQGVIDWITKALESWNKFTKTKAFKTVSGVLIDEPARNIAQTSLGVAGMQWQVIQNLLNTGSIFPSNFLVPTPGKVGGDTVINMQIRGLGVADMEREFSDLAKRRGREVVRDAIQ